MYAKWYRILIYKYKLLASLKLIAIKLSNGSYTSYQLPCLIQWFKCMQDDIEFNGFQFVINRVNYANIFILWEATHCCFRSILQCLELVNGWCLWYAILNIRNHLVESLIYSILLAISDMQS